MKIGIVIPLRAQSTISSWELVERNLRRTLNSVDRQTDKSYAAIVVGHDCPKFFREVAYSAHNQISFHRFTEFAPPQRHENLVKLYTEYEFDRCRKILGGMIELQTKQKISQWFALDADDLIHPMFTTVVKRYTNADAVIIDRGYSYYENHGVVHRENEFSAYCGSCTVLPSKYVELPDRVTEDNFRATLFGSVPHNKMASTLRSKGFHTAFPKERLVMYMRNHGGNLSDMRSLSGIIPYLKFRIKNLTKKPLNQKKIFNDFNAIT